MSEQASTFEQDIQQALSDPANQGNPLQPLLAQLWGKYFDLSQRIDRVARISDAYQSEMLERKSSLDEQLDKQLRRLQKLARISDSYQAMMRDLNAALSQASTHDVLTGLANRRLMIERLKDEVARSRRSGSALTMVMLDLDDFKSINDRHGHEAGDQVLIGIADVLRNTLRESDRYGRWGGEEFLLLLPETSLTDSQAILERLRAAINALRVPYDGKALSVTASAGLAEHHVGEAYSVTMNRADMALLQAKQEGRNRWEVAL